MTVELNKCMGQGGNGGSAHGGHDVHRGCFARSAPGRGSQEFGAPVEEARLGALLAAAHGRPAPCVRAAAI